MLGPLCAALAVSLAAVPPSLPPPPSPPPAPALPAAAPHPPAPAPLPPAHVLVLGVFHFDNPGRDMFNLKVDDVLAPARQRDVAELLEVLKAFRPTRIAVEAPVGSPRVEAQYAGLLAGTYRPGRNEIDQLGYRLAAALGHPRVHPVDVPGEFPFEPVAEFARRTGRQAELDAAIASVPAGLARVQAALSGGTLLDALRVVNDEAEVRASQRLYLALARFAGGGEYPGPDLAAAWFQRNARIFANVRALAAPGERVLVIYGAGHLHWLQRQVLESGDLVLERLEDYAPPRP